MTATQHPFWSGKCVLITGASSGIGLALAEHIAPLGAKVGLLARREERLKEISQQLSEAADACAFAGADVTQQASLAHAVEQLEEAIGPADVMVASAGVYRKTAAKSFCAEAASQVISTNLQGVINSFAAVLPGMLKRDRGQLVGISSLAGKVALPAGGAYCGSKAAVDTLMESLRVDLAKTNITVTRISPGYVDTPLITDDDRRLQHPLSAADAARRIARAIEQGRATYSFPWWPALLVQLANLLPQSLYTLAMRNQPPMEEP